MFCTCGVLLKVECGRGFIFVKRLLLRCGGSLFLLMVDPKDGGSCGVEFEYLCLHFVNYVAIQREEVVFLFTHY